MRDVNKWLAALTLAVACGACAGTDSSTAQSEDPAAAAEAVEGEKAAQGSTAPAYREISLPAGTTLRLDLASSISSDGSKIEDAVRATLREAVVVDGQTVVPMGAQLSGVVTDVEGSGRVKGRARIAYRFDSMSVGEEHYEIATAPTTHVAEATKGKDATKIGIGAGAGAAIGAIIGGGSGAAKGAVIGGAAGTGAVLATKGEEVRLGPGANVTTRLTAPLTIRVKT